MHKEVIEYIFTEDVVVGAFVNLPITIQMRTLDELRRASKEMIEVYIADLQKILDEDLLEFKEVKEFKLLKHNR